MRFVSDMTVGELQDEIHRLRKQIISLQDNFRARTADKFIGSKRYFELCEYVDNKLGDILESFN